LIGRLNVSEKINLAGTVSGNVCAGLDGGIPALDVPQTACLLECTGAVSTNCYTDGNKSYCPTVFPAPLAVAASFNRTLMQLRGAVTGTEARAFNNLHASRIGGGHVDLLGFGPDINLIVDPRNGRNGENPSEDGYLAGMYFLRTPPAPQSRSFQKNSEGYCFARLSVSVSQFVIIVG
jgi:hypothetical protein